MSEQKALKSLTSEELSEAHRQLIILDTQREQLYDILNIHTEKMEELVKQINFNQYFQHEDGTVFVIEEPKGTFVEYKKWKIRRTRRNGEESSSTNIPIKTVEESGLIVTNKHKK